MTNRLSTKARMPVVSASDGLSFTAHRGIAGLQQLERSWTELAESMPAMRFNHLPGLYRAFLASGGCDPDSVWFITAYRNQDLVAICPLQFQNHLVQVLQPRFLGTVDADELQLSDFVFAASEKNASLLYDLTRWLRKQRTLRWDVLRLVRVADDSSLGYAARARLPSLALAAQYDAGTYFNTSGTYEQATRRMSSKMRSNLRRRARLAERTAKLCFRSYSRTDELGDAFDTFLDIEASGWKGPAGSKSAIRCRPIVLAFYMAMVREFAARNECVVNLLWHGERAIAGQLGLHIGRTLYILKVGYREDNPTIAPGILLEDKTIKYACEEPGIDELNMVNDPYWAKGFKPDAVKVCFYSVPNWTVRGLLAQLGIFLKRSLSPYILKAAATPKDHA
jgi:hypothetical protein